MNSQSHSDLQNSYIYQILNKELCVMPFFRISGGSMLGREALLCWNLMVTCCSLSILRAIDLTASSIFFPLSISLFLWASVGWEILSAVLDFYFTSPHSSKEIHWELEIPVVETKELQDPMYSVSMSLYLNLYYEATSLGSCMPLEVRRTSLIRGSSCK